MAVRSPIAALENALSARDVVSLGCILLLWTVLAVASSVPAGVFGLAALASGLIYLGIRMLSVGPTGQAA